MSNEEIFSPVVRPLYVIAEEIKLDWSRPYFGAVPYLEALESLNSVNDKYGCDDAAYIISYFLANAGTWRGAVARRVKSELKGIVDNYYKSR